MNNKGQALVVFVLLLPIMFLIIAIVVDLGNLQYTKQKYVNEVKSTIEYGLKNIDDKNIKIKLENLLSANVSGDYIVEIDNQVIRINVKKEEERIFKGIFNDESYDINLTYIGYVDNNQIKINKE